MRDAAPLPGDMPASAQIIPFPARVPVPQAEPALFTKALAEDPVLRLQRALAMLEAAQTEQRAAIASWRGALGQLNSSMQGLGTSLGNCQTALDSITQS
jgi:hypothetical protein